MKLSMSRSSYQEKSIRSGGTLVQALKTTSLSLCQKVASQMISSAMSEWIKHFEEHSAKSQTGAHQLLLLDGYRSHCTYKFLDHCEKNKIVLFCLPPYATHLLQSLDIIVFQPYKHWHAEAVDTECYLHRVCGLQQAGIPGGSRINSPESIKAINYSFCVQGDWSYPIQTLEGG